METLSGKQWRIKTPHSSTPLIERVTEHRKISLDNELQDMHSPWLMKDISKAVERVITAIKDKQRIMVFGDYDVDGVTGASILYLGLKECGAEISARLPHREKDGYGLNTRAIDESVANTVELLITTDCGISNVNEVAYANEKGLDVIITDHHAIPPELPQAFAILNPKQEDCKYPEKEICGAVVAFKFLSAVYEQLGLDQQGLQKYIDMAALATVADCMPLVGENRLIVRKGLRQFKETQHRGLRTLMESYDLTDPNKALNSYHLGFNIAPCINAAGRLEDPLIAFKMMIGDQHKALELRRINEERQDVVRIALEEATTQVEKHHRDEPVLIFWQDHWQPGIIGLLAGRICERFHRPVICLTKHEDKYVGSCRSIPQINIVEHLQAIEELFLNYGGHAQAAGLSISPENLETFKERLTANVQQQIEKHPIEAYLSVDTEVQASEITMKNIALVEQLEPFGMGNPKPKLILKNLEVAMTRPVGKEKNHLQLGLKQGQSEWKGIAFQMAEHESQLKEWGKIDVVCQMNKNTFRGQTTIDLQVSDAREASSP